MHEVSPLVLVLTVLAVGVFHTVVPDHWAPIVVIARQQGWSPARTVKAAALAGVGHVTSTLILGAILWALGAIVAARYAHGVSLASALALIGFGGWIAYGGWKELREDDNAADEAGGRFGHAHMHRHVDGLEHVHWHEHREEDWHPTESGTIALHAHSHAATGRTALLLILGSSPMVEGLPAFASASTQGPGLLAAMAIVFAVSTIVTYAAMCYAGLRGLERTSLGSLERYGEVLSGLVVAAVGVYALVTA